MPTFTVEYNRQCTGGEHITLDVLRDGVKIREMTVIRTEILTTDLNYADVLPFFLRETIKRAGATTLGQARTAIEAASWEL